MRLLVLSMQTTLDGYIEGPDGDSGFVEQDNPEQWEDLFEMLEDVDLLLLGRVMFPDYRKFWKQALTGKNFSANQVKYATWADSHQHVVFSSTLKDADWDNTRIEKGLVVETVANLKEQPGKNIYVVGGAKLAATLLEAGLVDELRLTVNPVIVGGGKSFFYQQHARTSYYLVESKPLVSGAIIVTYRKK